MGRGGWGGGVGGGGVESGMGVWWKSIHLSVFDVLFKNDADAKCSNVRIWVGSLFLGRWVLGGGGRGGCLYCGAIYATLTLFLVLEA